MSIQLVQNHEFNGLELYFSEKPEESVLVLLRSAHWRYHRQKKCWYAKQTPDNISLAEQLTQDGNDGATATTTDTASSTPVPFFPSYDTVDGVPIYRSADLSCWEHDAGYFADINAFMEVSVRRILIIDLRNALLPGKECDRLVLEPEDVYNSTCLHAGLGTFRAVYDKYFVDRELPDCHIYHSTEKSMRCFTPFRKIKPIKAPDKWTLPHVWKAILSGQIFMGQCDYRYTDDYAYDAATDFLSGVPLHMPSLAKELIESPSGWSAYPRKNEDGVLELSVGCHSYLSHTVYFDEACDWPDNLRRAQERANELQRYNGALEARVLPDEDVMKQTETGLLFDVTYLDKHQNTGRYETKRKVVPHCQFLAGHMTCYDIIEIAPRPIDNTTLYEIVCGCYVQADPRVIRYEERNIVTGKALKELLLEHADDEQIAAVSICRQGIADLENALDDRLTGRVQNLFNPTPQRQIVKLLEQLSREAERSYEEE